MFSRRSHRTVTGVAAIALFATACGGPDTADVPSVGAAQEATTDQPATDTTPESTPESTPPTTTSPPATTTPATTTPATTPPASTAPASTTPPSTSPPSTDPATTAPPLTAPPVAAGDETATAALTAALQQSQAETSYTFTTGMRMSIAMDGISMTVGDDETVVGTGTFDETGTYIEMALGDFMASMFDSMGASFAASDDLDDPDAIDELLSQFSDPLRGQTMHMWEPADSTVITIDASGLMSAMVEAFDQPLGPLDALANGPVSFDPESIDADQLISEFGVTGGDSDPTLILEALAEADNVTTIGPAQVNGVDVMQYRATIDFETALAASGTTLDEAFLGEVDTDQFLDGLADTTYDVTYMVDADNRIRRTELTLDLDDALAAEPEFAGSAATASVYVWQEFDGHDGSYPIDPPDATDISNAVADLTDITGG